LADRWLGANRLRWFAEFGATNHVQRGGAMRQELWPRQNRSVSQEENQRPEAEKERAEQSSAPRAASLDHDDVAHGTSSTVVLAAWAVEFQRTTARHGNGGNRIVPGKYVVLRRCWVCRLSAVVLPGRTRTRLSGSSGSEREPSHAPGRLRTPESRQKSYGLLLAENDDASGATAAAVAFGAGATGQDEGLDADERSERAETDNQGDGSVLQNALGNRNRVSRPEANARSHQATLPQPPASHGRTGLVDHGDGRRGTSSAERTNGEATVQD